MQRPLDVVMLDIPQVDSLLMVGGTVLGTTNKGDPFAFPTSDETVCDRSAEIVEGYHELRLDAMIGIGETAAWRFCGDWRSRAAGIL